MKASDQLVTSTLQICSHYLRHPHVVAAINEETDDYQHTHYLVMSEDDAYERFSCFWYVDVLLSTFTRDSDPRLTITSGSASFQPDKFSYPSVIILDHYCHYSTILALDERHVYYLDYYSETTRSTDANFNYRHTAFLAMTGTSLMNLLSALSDPNTPEDHLVDYHAKLIGGLRLSDQDYLKAVRVERFNIQPFYPSSPDHVKQLIETGIDIKLDTVGSVNRSYHSGSDYKLYQVSQLEENPGQPEQLSSVRLAQAKVKILQQLLDQRQALTSLQFKDSLVPRMISFN